METYLKKAVNNKRLDTRYKRREYSRDRDYGSFRDPGPSEITAGDPGLPGPVLTIGGMPGMTIEDMVPGPKMTERRVTTAR